MPSVNSVSRWTFLTVLLAGLADGFNPCAFSIIIVLAGILAVGGRKRRARMLGGWAFCIASFLTYMAMGLGLMRVLRALEDLRIIHDVIMVLLSISLFVLAILSIRDAFRYRKEKVPSAITLQLPDKVKRLIRVVAETSWSGPAVVITGFGCGFLVTLLDSLCTGQIYIPVLALISREVEAWRSFMFLVVYNLAFIAPLIVIFILAAKGADSERMSRWSKRNVFPSKIAMGFVFVILGALVLPKFGGFLVDAFIK
jgi:cytochrome c biogenesis protein CcdA